MPPPIRYVRSGDVAIAYQVVGEGPHDLLMVPGWVSHLALDWEEPTWVRWCERITSFARLVRFDKRGTGLSDRPPGVATLEERMDDARAVLDAVGLDRAHVMGWSEGGPLAVLLAVAYPERVHSLVLYGTQACFARKADYPWGLEERADLDALATEIEAAWGDPEQAPGVGVKADERFMQRWATYQQAGAGPAAAAALIVANHQIDVRPLLSSIRAPTLVLSRTDDPIGPPDAARYMAERIPSARFVELPGNQHLIWLGDVEELGAEIEAFVTGVRPAVREPGRVLAILQCDIEGSTLLADRLEDERWGDVLAEYSRLARRAVSTFGGTLIDQTGDGFMAAFEGPVSAVRGGRWLQEQAHRLGVRVRAGVHIGEVQERDGALRGIAVHVAARVMAKAAGDELLVSETVRDIVAGSALRFDDRGLHELKGIEGARRLFAVSSA
jgi:pimeloyl-ACP methyl ester carboxylesterase